MWGCFRIFTATPSLSRYFSNTPIDSKYAK
nr:MAG TPA_asm: hypothetical protein [Caudoviricetes sp.]